MSFLNQLNLLNRIHFLIKKKGTGSPKEFAIRLGISRTSIFRQIGILKKMGARIYYCKHRNSYVYEEDFILSFSFLEYQN